MLLSLKRKLERTFAVEAAASKDEPLPVVNLAAAALLIEAAEADCDFQDEEIDQIRRSLTTQFAIPEQEIDELLELAHAELDSATCLHEITTVINDNWGLRDKVRLLEALWRVVLSDQKLDPHEQHLMRKLQGLLYIPQSEYIAAKIRAKSELRE